MEYSILNQGEKTVVLKVVNLVTLWNSVASLKKIVYKYYKLCHTIIRFRKPLANYWDDM